MTEALRRGSVVLRGRFYSIVWDVETDRRLAAIPILLMRRSGLRAGDVALELEELIPANIMMPRAFARVPRLGPLDRAGLQHVGEMTGRSLCRVVQAVIRAANDRAIDRRWALHRQHRELVRIETTLAA